MYTVTLNEMIQNNVTIFDFDYPIFREEYRETFQQHFIDYFLDEEIAHETVAQFKLRLKSKLNLIMPYYNKIFMTQEMEQRILDNYDVTETYNRSVVSDTVNNSTTSLNNKNNVVSKNLYKDAPKTKIDIEKFDTVTNLTKNEGTTSADGFSSNTEKWERRMTGNIGVQTDADAIVKYWTSLRKVEQEIFDELECLFMGVY